MFSKKERSSRVVRGIDLSIISHSPASKNSKRAADGRQKSHMRLLSRRLPTSGFDSSSHPTWVFTSKFRFVIRFASTVRLVTVMGRLRGPLGGEVKLPLIHIALNICHIKMKEFLLVPLPKTPQVNQPAYSSHCLFQAKCQAGQLCIPSMWPNKGVEPKSMVLAWTWSSKVGLTTNFC